MRLCDSYDGTHPARRELIRLLSSRLPVGKIPGIWEFILPLFYNSLSLSPALYCFHTRCHKIRAQSPINLSPLTILFAAVTTNRLLFSVAPASIFYSHSHVATPAFVSFSITTHQACIFIHLQSCQPSIPPITCTSGQLSLCLLSAFPTAPVIAGHKWF